MLENNDVEFIAVKARDLGQILAGSAISANDWVEVKFFYCHS